MATSANGKLITSTRCFWLLWRLNQLNSLTTQLDSAQLNTTSDTTATASGVAATTSLARCNDNNSNNNNVYIVIAQEQRQHDDNGALCFIIQLLVFALGVWPRGEVFVSRLNRKVARENERKKEKKEALNCGLSGSSTTCFSLARFTGWPADRLIINSSYLRWNPHLEKQQSERLDSLAR